MYQKSRSQAKIKWKIRFRRIILPDPLCDCQVHAHVRTITSQYVNNINQVYVSTTKVVHATVKQKICLENCFQGLNYQIIYLIYISDGTGVHHSETMFRLHDLGLYVECQGHRPLSKSVIQTLLSFPSTNCHSILYKFPPWQDNVPGM